MPCDTVLECNTCMPFLFFQVIFSLEQAVAYLKCIQNSVLQQGVAAMMWQMFVTKKLSATAYLVEKVSWIFFFLWLRARILHWPSQSFSYCTFSKNNMLKVNDENNVFIA